MSMGPCRAFLLPLLLILLAMATVASAGFTALDVESDRFDVSQMVARIEADKLGEVKDGVIHEYIGPLCKAAEVVAFRKRLPEVRRAALASQGKILGLPQDFEAHCFVVISDRDAADASGNNMTTTSREIESKTYSLVRVYADGLISGRLQADSTLTHELNHALLREYLGEAYLDTPTWWREGVAVHAAGQTERRLRVLMAGQLVESARSLARGARIVPALINGLNDRHDFDDYAEDTLMIEYAVSVNPNAIAEMVERIRDEESADEAFAATIGMSWRDALAVGMDYARRRLYALEDGRYVTYYNAMQKLTKLKASTDEGGTEALLAFVKETDKALGYDAALSVEAQPYTSALWIYHRSDALADAGDHALASADLIREINEEDGLLRESALTPFAIRLVIEYSISAQDFDSAEEWAERLYHGFSASQTSRAFAREQLEKIADARAAADAAKKKSDGESD